MSTHDLAIQVQKMRSAQNRYFRERTPAAIREARDWERRIDRMCEEILETPSMFAENSSDRKR